MNNENDRILKEKVFEGIPASPGIAIGKAFIFDEAEFWVEEKSISPENIGEEKDRFKKAVDDVIKDIRTLKYKLEQKIGKEEARIFDPHIMLLQDPALINETNVLIESGKNAEFAFFRTTRKITKAYKRVQDEYMRQRIDDITDILKRVYIKLQGKEYTAFSNIKSPVIVVSTNLSPSDTANMHTGNVMAFVTDTGGVTSHATIIARSLGIPAVLGLKTASTEISPGDFLIVDGGNGKVYVNPNREIIDKYQKNKENIEKIRVSLLELRDLPAVTKDGKTIGLHANIEFPEEVDAVIENGAQGVGLFRSEYHFIFDDKYPSEDELYKDYLKVAQRLAPKPVVIRTFDLGGDKISHLIPSSPEVNPFLGWRAIRVSLAMKEFFKVHLRAIVRASIFRNLKIMFPMISSMDELNETITIIDEVKNELESENIDFDHNLPIGVMIEIPSAVMIAEHLAEKVNYFSIGTNDLIQYSVAVDRTNNRIAYLYEPFHPGILKLIKITVDSAHKKGIPVSVCGEMSSDIAGALILIGLGVDELSMAPSFIPSVKRMIRNVTMEKVKNIASKALMAGTASEVKELIKKEFKSISI